MELNLYAKYEHFGLYLDPYWQASSFLFSFSVYFISDRLI